MYFTGNTCQTSHVNEDNKAIVYRVSCIWPGSKNVARLYLVVYRSGSRSYFGKVILVGCITICLDLFYSIIFALSVRRRLTSVLKPPQAARTVQVRSLADGQTAILRMR